MIFSPSEILPVVEATRFKAEVIKNLGDALKFLSLRQF